MPPDPSRFETKKRRAPSGETNGSVSLERPENSATRGALHPSPVHRDTQITQK